MGLNPPFGVKYALAKKVINKALEFKPKYGYHKRMQIIDNIYAMDLLI